MRGIGQRKNACGTWGNVQAQETLPPHGILYPQNIWKPQRSYRHRLAGKGFPSVVCMACNAPKVLKVTRAAAVVPTPATPRCLQPLPSHQRRVHIAKTLSVLTTTQTLQAIQVFKLCFHTAATINRANGIFYPKTLRWNCKWGYSPWARTRLVLTYLLEIDTHPTLHYAMQRQ